MSRRSRFCRGSEQARPARARNAGARLAAWLQAGLASSTQPAFVPTRAGGLHPDGGSILADVLVPHLGVGRRSEEHTSELQSLMRISYAVFCLKKKKDKL